MDCLNLSDIRPPPSGKEGWPWTVETPPLPDTMPGGAPWPRISIVTPSLNQGAFIEETIRSVLLQGYPNLEYIVIDGGSTDGSVEIIEKYSPWITDWVSEPDRGQSHAINKGFEKATGDIYGWLNSDDLLMPGALERIAEVLDHEEKADLLTGGVAIRYSGERELQPIRPCGAGLRPTVPIMLVQHGYVGQPATFWRKCVWQVAGPLREELHYAMDHEFFLRSCDNGCRFRLINDTLAIIQDHPDQKTKHGSRYIDEFQQVVRPYLERRELAGLRGKLERYFVTKLLALARHRNIHPRIGLVPKINAPLPTNRGD